MHRSHKELQHDHLFHSGNRKVERKISFVVALNAITMAGEIIAGTIFGSMALVADGWHMGTHMLALGITLAAYSLARRYIRDTGFAFGTWKIEILGGYTSAILLGIVGLSMIWASIERILSPVPIHYNQALLVAVIGLVVNIASALFLGSGTPHEHHTHSHGGHNHDHSSHRQQDLNMRAAYIHVVTDALTSLLAIVALVAAKYLSWNFFDPVAGIIGAVLILRWTVGLLTACGSILLDREEKSPLVETIRQRIESDGVSRISDLHVWQIARDKYACIIALVTRKDGFTIADFKERLSDHGEIVHISIELHHFT
jgi:cation diffusion facilitator family transporter